MNKNRTAYFGISKSNRFHFTPEIEVIRTCLKNHNIDLMVFVDKYNFNIQEEKEMMKIAFEEIDRCDLLVIELTKKAIGVGVEVGYARAKNKPIVYLKRINANHSTTVGGSANFIAEYKDPIHLEQQLNKIIKLI